MNDLRLSFQRSVWGVIHLNDFSMASLGIPIPNANTINNYGLASQSNLTVNGYFAENLGAPSRNINNTIHLSNTLSWIRGIQQIAFGFEAYRNVAGNTT